MIISPSSQKLIAAGIVLLGAVAGYLFYSQAASSAVAIPPLEIGRDLKRFEKLNFNFSIFDRVTFKELQIFGESPVQRGTEGKSDLFAPF